MEISRRIVTYALFLFSLLVSTIFSIDISACANLNTQGTTYTLISSISTNALSCFNITAENVTFNLNGFLINGTKQANSIGIYTTAKNSTITNGIIDGFEKGVYLANTQLGTIDNITAMTSVAGGKGIFLSNVNSITIINSNGTSSSSNGIYISSSNYNQIINSTAYSQSSYAIYVDSSTYNNVTGSVGYTSSLDTGRGIYVWSSNFTTIKYSAGRAYFGIGIDSGQNNSIINSNGTSSSYCGICIRFSSSGNSIITSNGTTSSTTVSGIYISSSNYNQIINSTSTSTSYFGLELTDSSWNNITGSNISTHSQTKSGLKLTNADNSIIANNTIGGNPPSNKACINISSTSSDNLFYHNELYNCLTYIDNQNDTNLFNTTSNGIAQGNYYQNILGLPIYDTDNDGWGDYGSGYPLSASTQGGNWTGYGQDWGPRGATVDPSLLGSCSNLTSPGTTYTLIRNITNWTSGTCFYISAENVTLNGAGYTIVGDNITGSHGISINASNVVVANITIYNFTTHLGIYGYTRNVSIDNVKLMHAKNRAGGHNLYIDWTVNNTKINKVNSSVLISNGGEPFLHAGYIRGFNHTINNSFFQGRGWAGLWLSASNCTIENTETQTWYYLALFIDGPNNRFNNLTSFSSSGVGVAIRYPNAVVNNSHIKVTGYNGAFTVGYSGGYKVDGTIIENTVINQTNIPAGSGSANAFDVNLANQTTLKNLTVESNGGYAFIVRDSYNNNVENVRVYSKRNMSLYIEKAGNITILNSEFIANSSEGVYLSYSQNVTLQNVYANSTSSTGIYIYNSQNITLANVTGESAGIYPAFGLKASETSLNITGSTIRGIGENATYGLGVFYSPSVNITNSLITSNKGIALWIANLTSGAIQNSTINSSNNVGLYLENSTNGSIRYVNISSGLQLAVNLSNTSSFVFENNTISSPTTCINISFESSNNLFYHNELYNCTTYIDNKNETNLFNTTASGTAQGNYYQNILGLPIYDTDNDGWGDYGSGYPLSASTQ
ncbi:MAG: right-handed parallel beta-helix repeat-containing protein, partial [Candidatus Anstonellales archaeon]